MKKFLKRVAYSLLSVFIFFNIICAVQAYHFTRFVNNAVRQNPREMGLFQKTGAILFGVPVPRSKVADSLPVPHRNVIITTEDGLKLTAWHAVHHAPGKPPRGTIILFHGHGSNRSGLIKETEAFYNLGWNTLSVDFRNHGGSGGNTCSVGYFEARDVKAAYDYAKATGAATVVLYGASMGAATITKAMHDYKTLQPQQLILEMPFGSMQQATEGFVKVMNLPAEPLGFFLSFWGGTELGIWAFANKPVEYAKDIHCKTLLQWGQKDFRVTPAETQTIYCNLGTKDKKLVIYPNSGHQSLCKNEHEKWMQEIAVFLNQ